MGFHISFKLFGFPFGLNANQKLASIEFIIVGFENLPDSSTDFRLPFAQYGWTVDGSFRILN